MQTIFSTQDYSEAKRFSVFRETIKDQFLVSYDCQPSNHFSEHSFYAILGKQQIADLTFVLVHSNAHCGMNAPQKTEQNNEDHFYIELQRSGSSILSQDGRKEFLRQGDFIFFDTARPNSWLFDTDYSLYRMIIPRDKLSRKLGDTKNLTGRAIRGNTLMGGLVYSFFLKYMPALNSVDPINAQHLADILLDLVTAALSDLSVALPIQRMGRSTLLYMAQQYITDNLHDPNLNAEGCANACGISLRYLQEIFQKQNTTINKWIWKKRFELYKNALINPLMAGKNISQIAYDCGFNDISNLNRKFKSTFSITPSEYRKEYIVCRKQVCSK